MFTTRKAGKAFWDDYPLRDHPELQPYVDLANTATIVACSGCKGFLSPDAPGMTGAQNRLWFLHAKKAHNASYVVTPTGKPHYDNPGDLHKWNPVGEDDELHNEILLTASALNKGLPPQCHFSFKGIVLKRGTSGLVSCVRCGYDYPYQDRSDPGFKDQFDQHYKKAHGYLRPPEWDDLMSQWECLVATSGPAPSSRERPTGARGQFVPRQRL